MKSDPSNSIALVEAGNAADAGSKTPSRSALSELAVDAASLSSDQARVRALVAQTATLPEIRSEKVARLASEVRDGTHQVSPEQIAEAILAELERRSGVAA